MITLIVQTTKRVSALKNKIEYMRAIHDLKWGKITASECATRIRYSAPTIIEADKEQEDGNVD